MNIFKSRTVWAIIVGLILTTIQASHDLMPTEVYLLLEGILSALAVYFRANPQA